MPYGHMPFKNDCNYDYGYALADDGQPAQQENTPHIKGVRRHWLFSRIRVQQGTLGNRATNFIKMSYYA
jgi:hypothetical protein